MPSFADVVGTSYSLRRRLAFVPWCCREQCWPVVMSATWQLSTRCVLEVSKQLLHALVLWHSSIANSSNRLERLQQERGLIVFRALGWIDRCWIDRVMNRPRDEPIVLNRPVMNRPVMKRPGIVKIIRIDFDDIWQKYSKYFRIESACFGFRVGFRFYQLFVFQTGHRK